MHKLCTEQCIYKIKIAVFLMLCDIDAMLYNTGEGQISPYMIHHKLINYILTNLYILYTYDKDIRNNLNCEYKK